MCPTCQWPTVVGEPRCPLRAQRPDLGSKQQEVLWVNTARSQSCSFPCQSCKLELTLPSSPSQSATWKATIFKVNSTELEQNKCYSYKCDSGERRISLYSTMSFPGWRGGNLESGLWKCTWLPSSSITHLPHLLSG